MDKGIYLWKQDFGRMGRLEAVFVATAEEVEASYGVTIYPGEVLGKHSDVEVTLVQEQFNLITEEPKAVEAWGDLEVGLQVMEYAKHPYGDF